MATKSWDSDYKTDSDWCFNPLMATLKKTAQQRIIIQQYGYWYTGRW